MPFFQRAEPRSPIRRLAAGYLAASAVLVIIAWLALLFVDTNSAVTDMLSARNGPVNALRIVTDSTASKVLVLCGLLVLIRFKFNPRVLFTAALALAITALTVTSIKGLVRRPRPSLTRAMTVETENRFLSSWSFVSGDAAGAVAAVASLAVFLSPAWQVPLYVIALAVSAARVLVRAHYVSDIAAGAAVGLLAALAAAAIIERLFRRAHHTSAAAPPLDTRPPTP